MVTLRTANPPQVEWQELNEMSFSARPDGWSSVRQAIVAGADVRNFIKSIGGYSVFSPPANLERFPPEPHPIFDWMVVRSIEFLRPLDLPTPHGPFESLQYDEVALAVTYEDVPGVQFLPDYARPAGVTDESWRFTKREIQSNYVIQTLPSGILLFNEDDTVIPEQTGQVMQSRCHRYLWHEIPAVITNGVPGFPGRLQQTIDETAGCMNSDTFSGVAPENLLCLDPEVQWVRMKNGKLAANIQYLFQQRGGPDLSGFPLIARSDTPSFTRIIRKEGNFARVYRRGAAGKLRSIYDSKPFGRLFRFD